MNEGLFKVIIEPVLRYWIFNCKAFNDLVDGTITTQAVVA
jgi:hypothetical protein